LEVLLKQLQHIYQLPPDAQAALSACFHEVVMAKHDFLLTEGKICRHLYFLEQGALRGFYHLDGKEITHWFGFEMDFVTSFHSFITQEPSVENIQLIEGSVLWAVAKEDVTRLLNEHREIERLVRIAYEKYYIRLEERFVNAQFRTATELYDKLMLEKPHILERVPLGQVASYLGISQETLSRIRGRH
jgi:CRP-like cAMP-binding protein